ncbi:NAD-dependent epimerase/dehydratase family protein [Saccharothrix deserti]|uniref:NAD-dependent epimerase/dehydratase family protein n=1 Tax=Saccharothrix deserti TaxID=2593674 RepID=UPI00192E3411|nr:NAD(P)-dependent oxidoreductase [Saccharothrix deserti]
MIRALVTGATGFIGRHLVRHLVRRGYQVTAFVRPTSRRGGLTGVRFAEGDLVTGEGLRAALRDVDCVFHLAGVIKARTPADYYRGNRLATRTLACALAAVQDPPRLVHCSSLSAAGPATPDRPRTEDQPCTPVSHYGHSKLRAEREVTAVSHLVPVTIVRPPIVYGPGDREFLGTLAPMARLGVMPKSGRGSKSYSLIHVDDLCVALITAATGPCSVYYVSDGVEHRWEDICTAFATALGVARPVVVPVPGAALQLAATAAELLGRVTGTVPILNRDKAREARYAAWTCSADRIERVLGFRAAIPLDVGLAHAAARMSGQGMQPGVRTGNWRSG